MAVLNFFADGAGHPDYRPPVERGDTDHYCIAGLLVDDRQREQLETGVDAIIQRYFPHREPRTVELKAAWISARVNQKPPWDALPGPQHAQLFDDVRDLLMRVRPVLFGQIVHKDNYRQSIRASRPERPATNVLRFLMGRLDHHLASQSDTTRATLDADLPAIQEAQRTLEAEVRTDGDKIAGVTRRYVGSDAIYCGGAASVLPSSHTLEVGALAATGYSRLTAQRENSRPRAPERLAAHVASQRSSEEDPASVASRPSVLEREGDRLASP